MFGDETNVRKVTCTHFSKTQEIETPAAVAQSTLTVVDSKHYSGNVHTKPWLGLDIINIDSSVHNYNNHFSTGVGTGEGLDIMTIFHSTAIHCTLSFRLHQPVTSLKRAA